MSHSFIEDLESIIRASAGGSMETGALSEQVFAALDRSGMPDETYLPAYFVEGLGKLAARQLADWTDVADAEIGLSWVLRDLVPFIPGAVFRDQPGRDEVVVPALGLALAIETSNTKDRWAVVAEGAAAAVAADHSPARAIRSFDTLHPTAEQLEQWARDPELRLIGEDEIIALFNSQDHFALLVRLALDPATVKLRDLLTALDEMVTLTLWRMGGAAIALIDQALASMPKDTGDVPGATRAWLDGLEKLRSYALGSGAISLEAAGEMAAQLLKGRRRSAVELAQASVGAWWQFSSTVSGALPREYLYVHPDTGALRFSAIALTAEQLATLGDIQHRLPRS